MAAAAYCCIHPRNTFDLTVTLNNASLNPVSDFSFKLSYDNSRFGIVSISKFSDYCRLDSVSEPGTISFSYPYRQSIYDEPPAISSLSLSDIILTMLVLDTDTDPETCTFSVSDQTALLRRDLSDSSTGPTNTSHIFTFKEPRNASVDITGPSSDAALSDLTVLVGGQSMPLTPAFSPNALNYEVTVGYYIPDLQLNWTKSDPNAIVNYTPPEGNMLRVGDNVFKVTVTAEDGATTRTYTVVVHRRASDDGSDTMIDLNDPNTAKTLVFGGHKYSVYNIELSWADAKAYCEAQGGHLAVITSQIEQAVVQGMLTSARGYYWLGGSDAETEGTFRWVTGEDFNYTNWSDGNPDDYNSNEDYIGMRPDGSWNDCLGSSNDNAGFVCEWEDRHYLDNYNILNNTGPADVKIFEFDDIRYHFGNYDEYYSWNDFASVFGNTEEAYALFSEKLHSEKNRVIYSFSGGTLYRSAAVCYGMTSTSLLLQNGISPSSFNNSSRVCDIEKHYTSTQINNLSAQDFIGKMLLSQYCYNSSHNSEMTQYMAIPNDVYYDDLKGEYKNQYPELSDDEIDAKLTDYISEISNPVFLQRIVDRLLRKENLYFCISKTGGAHAVTPYKIRILNDHELHVYVYDCNDPNNNDRYLSIWKSPNSDGGYSEYFNCWHYFAGYSNGKEVHYGSDYPRSGIRVVDYSITSHAWNNMGHLNITENGDEPSNIISVTGGAAINPLHGASAAFIKDGHVLYSDIDGLVEVVDAGEDGNSEDTDNGTLVYLPQDEYKITNTGADSISLMMTDTHSSITADIPAGGSGTVNVSDSVDNSLSIELPDGAEASGVAFRFGYDDEGDGFVNEIVVLGSAQGGSVTARIAEGGLLVEGCDDMTVGAQKAAKRVETDKVDTNNGEDSSVLITLGGGNILSIDENTDGDGSFETNLLRREAQTVVTGIEITNDDIVLPVGGTASLNTVMTPADHTDAPTVLYFSEDEEIAAVSENGVITARKAGETEIHCMISPTVTDVIKVTVTGADDDADKLALSIFIPGREGGTPAVMEMTSEDGDSFIIQVPYAKNGSRVTVPAINGKTYKLTIIKPGCTSYTDNSFAAGTDTLPGELTLYAGELTGDGRINAKDQAALTDVFGLSSKDDGYYAAADFNEDGHINSKDRADIIRNFAKTSTVIG